MKISGTKGVLLVPICVASLQFARAWDDVYTPIEAGVAAESQFRVAAVEGAHPEILATVSVGKNDIGAGSLPVVDPCLEELAPLVAADPCIKEEIAAALDPCLKEELAVDPCLKAEVAPVVDPCADPCLTPTVAAAVDPCAEPCLTPTVAAAVDPCADPCLTTAAAPAGVLGWFKHQASRVGLASAAPVDPCCATVARAPVMRQVVYEEPFVGKKFRGKGRKALLKEQRRQEREMLKANNSRSFFGGLKDHFWGAPETVYEPVGVVSGVRCC